ncbi:MAG: lysoplasmalogenase [Woeseiaceae bacterium]
MCDRSQNRSVRAFDGASDYNEDVLLFSTRSFVVLASSGCFALVIFQLLDYDVAAATAKLIASTAFVAVVVQAGGLHSRYGQLILLGLVFSWFGDMLLVGQARSFFLMGLGSFLFAHIAYIAAFIVKGINVRYIAVAILPIAAVGIAVSVWLTPYIPPELIIPVRAYTFAISLMLIAAIGTRGRGATVLIFAGALMFFLSDLSVAALRLVQTALPTYVLGLPLYYAGQLCLAASVSQSQSDQGIHC